MTVSLTYLSVIGVPVSAATTASRLVIRWQLIRFVLVVVELRIDKSAPDIPASAKAVVAKRSTRSTPS